MTKEIEELLKRIKILKPGECALIYDEKRGRLLGICNKRGKIELTLDKKLEEI